jgi:hypothetical protein
MTEGTSGDSSGTFDGTSASSCIVIGVSAACCRTAKGNVHVTLTFASTTTAAFPGAMALVAVKPASQAELVKILTGDEPAKPKASSSALDAEKQAVC